MRVHKQVSCYLHLTGHKSGQVQNSTKHENCFKTKQKKTKQNKKEEKIKVGVDGNGEKIYIAEFKGLNL